MYIRRQLVWFIKRADADEADMLAQTAHIVVAPDRSLAFGAAGDVLAGAAGGRNRDLLDLARDQLHPIRFKKGIQSKGRAGVFLTAAAMAAMDDQGHRGHPIADMVAGAATVSRLGIVAHDAPFFCLLPLDYLCRYDIGFEAVEEGHHLAAFIRAKPR